MSRSVCCSHFHFTDQTDITFNHVLILFKLGKTNEACSIWMQLRGFPLDGTSDQYQHLLNQRNEK